MMARHPPDLTATPMLDQPRAPFLLARVQCVFAALVGVVAVFELKSDGNADESQRPAHAVA